MFYKCKSLSSLPNILVCDSSKFYCLFSIFGDCESLTTLFAQGKLEMDYYKYYQIYQGCVSLSFILNKKSYCYLMMQIMI